VHGELELLEEDNVREKEEEEVYDRPRRMVSGMEIIEHPKVQKVCWIDLIKFDSCLQLGRGLTQLNDWADIASWSDADLQLDLFRINQYECNYSIYNRAYLKTPEKRTKFPLSLSANLNFEEAKAN